MATSRINVLIDLMRQEYHQDRSTRQEYHQDCVIFNNQGFHIYGRRIVENDPFRPPDVLPFYFDRFI